MAIIGLVGGHGVGKSTAVRRWKARYRDLIDVYSLDDLRKEFYDNQAKIELVQRLHQQPKVAVVESAKGFSAWLKLLTKNDFILMVTPSTSNLGRQWMEQRRGRPLTGWWGARQLQYELIDKFLNYSSKHLAHVPQRHFSIGDQLSGWETIDQFFYSLFRRLHNARNQ